jgi:hypothetical protein
MTAFLNPWVILTFVLALLGAYGGGHYTGEKSGRAEIQQKWDKEKADQYADFAKRQEEARKTEREMQAEADRLRREKDAEIRNINARATALANSLRDRTERPAKGSGVSSTTGSCTGASGAELARGDGEFLAGYSTDAAKLAKALDICEQQYAAAKKKLNKE